VEKITSVGWRSHVSYKLKLRKPEMIDAVINVLLALAVCGGVFLAAWWLLRKL
jgi:hypothetical protein